MLGRSGSDGLNRGHRSEFNQDAIETQPQRQAGAQTAQVLQPQTSFRQQLIQGLMAQLIRFEIDELPLGLHRPGGLDFIGRYVGAAALEPLLRFDDLRRDVGPGVLVEGTTSRDGLRHRYRVGQNLRWSDGRAICGEDVAKHLHRTRARHRYWAHHLRWISRVEGRGDILAVDVGKPIRHLPALLCADELAPIADNPWNPGQQTLGPFVFSGIDADQSRLNFKPNPFYPENAERSHLAFDLRRDVFGVPDRFLDHAVDITCSTMFPFQSLGRWSGHPDFHSGPAPIWMQIEFGSDLDPALLRRDVRAQLSVAVDRASLSKFLLGGASPRHGVLGTTRQSAPPATHATAAYPINRTLRAKLSTVRLAYYDYYPNRQVAEFVRKSWADALDLDVSLVPVTFEAPVDIATDLRLELRYPAFPDPLAELEPAIAMLSRVGSTDDCRQAAKLVMDIQHTSAKGLDRCLVELARLLDGSVATIPLLDIRHNWLMSPRVTGFTLPHLGNLRYDGLKFRPD